MTGASKQASGLASGLCTVPVHCALCNESSCRTRNSAAAEMTTRANDDYNNDEDDDDDNDDDDDYNDHDYDDSGDDDFEKEEEDKETRLGPSVTRLPKINEIACFRLLMISE